MKRRFLFASVVLALSTAVVAPIPASAQDLFIVTDHTISGGNPLNGVYGIVNIGVDSAYTPVPNVQVDITGGNVAILAITNNALVTISDGNIGSAFGVAANEGSTLNITGGSINTALTFGNYNGSSNHALNTLNISGGFVNWVDIFDDSLVTVSGGFVGTMANRAAGSIHITGGTVSVVYNGASGTIDFGGSAATDMFLLDGGTSNITGGTINHLEGYGPGAAIVSGGNIGKIIVGGVSLLTINGSGLSVTEGTTRGAYDGYIGINYIATDYTVTGTLGDGTVLNTTFAANTGYTGDTTSLTFQGSGFTQAPDLFVTTDSTLTDIYNVVTIGTDATGTEIASPTVTYNADSAWLTTENGANVTVTGGVVHAVASVNGDSQFTVTGGEVGVIRTSGSSTTTLSGGQVNYVLASGNSTVILNGGSAPANFSLLENSSLVVQGSGLTGTGTAGAFWDANSATNYINAGVFTVTGMLTDGTTIDTSILAGGVSGDSSQQTLTAATVASDLYVTEDRTVSEIKNQVFVGTDSTFSINTSPTAVITDGANLGYVTGLNASTIKVQGGLINGDVVLRGVGGTLEVSGGTLAGTVAALPGNNTIKVTGGAIPGVVFNIDSLVEILGGTVGVVDSISFTGEGATTNIGGGDIGLVYGEFGSVTNISGGSIGELLGYGGTFNIYGGLISPDSLANLTGSMFNLYGSNITLTGGALGTFTDGTSGAWWNLNGTLANGDTLSTRYFEAGGNLSGAGGINVAAAAPEPGSLMLLAAALPLAGWVRRRRK